MGPKIYKFEEFQLENERRRLLKNDEPVEVSPRGFDVLVYLVEKSGETISRDELFNTVWKDAGTEEAVLTDTISKLRKSLGDDKKPYKIIETIPRKGYQFIAPVEIMPVVELGENSETEEIKNEQIFNRYSEAEKITEERIEETNKAVNQSRAILTLIDQEQVGNAFSNVDKESQDNKNLNNEPLNFEEWLIKSKVKWWFRVVVIVAILFSIFTSIISRESKIAILIGSLSNIALVVIAIVYYLKYSLDRIKTFRPLSKDLLKDSQVEVIEATKCKDESDWEDTRDNAKDGSFIFRVCWMSLLIIWAFLYSILFFKTLLANENEPNYWLGLFATLCNNLNTFLLTISFYTFNTLKEGIEELKKSGILFVGLFLILLLAVVEGVTLGGSGDLIWVKDEISWVFRVISGVGGAIALALFVGRLQSKFFKPATKFTVIFYSYIAIQPLYVFFDDKSVKMQFVTAIVIHIAVVLKYYLFIYLFWVFESGRLLFYLVRVRQANKEIEDEWKKFQIVLEKNTKENSITS